MRRRFPEDFPVSHPVCSGCWGRYEGKGWMSGRAADPPRALAFPSQAALVSESLACSLCDADASDWPTIPEPRRDLSILARLREVTSKAMDGLALAAIDTADIVAIGIEHSEAIWIRFYFDRGRQWFDWNTLVGAWEDLEVAAAVGGLVADAAYRLGLEDAYRDRAREVRHG